MKNAPSERWRLRLQNFSAAIEGLREAKTLQSQRHLSELEKAGFVQRFELSWELGWKLLADLLAADLAHPDPLTPASVIRSAFSAGMIADGDAWIAMSKLRNLLSHTYNKVTRDEGIALIAGDYLTLLEALEEVALNRDAQT